MRNALNKLADGVTDPAEKKVSTSMLPHPRVLSRQLYGSGHMWNWSLAECYELSACLRDAFTSIERILTHAVLRD